MRRRRSKVAHQLNSLDVLEKKNQYIFRLEKMTDQLGQEIKR
jgi:hypothetical protein